MGQLTNFNFRQEMIQIVFNHPRAQYYLVFCQHQTEPSDWRSKLLKWLLDRLKPGFSHVCVLIKRPGKPFICLESCSNNLFFDEIPLPDLLPQLVASGATILEVPRKKSQIGLRGLITCVSVAKHFLGINNWAVTPWQLYQSILKEQKNGWR